MSWLVAGALGGAILGGVSAYSSGKKGDKYMDQAMEQMQGNEARIDEFSGLADKFAGVGQDRFDRYTEMFDPMEDTLNEYYNNLNPNELAARGNQTAQQQYQQTMKQVNEQMAAQGMTGSGVSAQIALGNANQMAETKAQNIMDAPHEVANMQQGWMSYGANQQNQAFNQLGQGVQMQGEATNMYSQNNANIANLYGQQAQQSYGGVAGGLADMSSGLMAAAYFGGKE